MRNYRFLGIALALLLSCCTGVAGELFADEAALLAAMKSEPPMTQADIDIVIKLHPALTEVEDDLEKMEKLCADNGITPQRFQVVGMKMGAGAMMVLMKEQVTREILIESGQDAAMLPSDDELLLIEENIDVIKTMMNG